MQHKIFSDEYEKPAPSSTEARTQPPADRPDFSRAEQQDSLKIYGTGKPRREVIRAKIIHD